MQSTAAILILFRVCIGRSTPDTFSGKAISTLRFVTRPEEEIVPESQGGHTAVLRLNRLRDEPSTPTILKSHQPLAGTSAGTVDSDG